MGRRPRSEETSPHCDGDGTLPIPINQQSVFHSPARGELHKKQRNTENNAKDLAVHSFTMREEFQSHIQHFGTYFFAMTFQHKKVQRPAYAILN